MTTFDSSSCDLVLFIYPGEEMEVEWVFCVFNLLVSSLSATFLVSCF